MSNTMNLLRRAKARENAEAWPAGARIVRSLDRLDTLGGYVAFVDQGWVYWAADDGSCHATTPTVLRRLS